MNVSRLFVLTAALSIACAAHAAPINYGDFDDIPPGSVMYLDVTESSTTDPDIPPLFGAPSIAANELDFDPNQSFIANGGDDFSTNLNGRIETSAMAAPGTALVGLRIAEGGLYNNNGDTAEAVVQVSVLVTVLGINGSDLIGPFPISSTLTFAYNTPTSGDQPWTANASINFAPYLTAEGYDPATDFITKFGLSIDNTLSAYADDGETSSISKTDFKFEVLTEPIPTPAALPAGLLALGAIAMRRRRR